MKSTIGGVHRLQAGRDVNDSQATVAKVHVGGTPKPVGVRAAMREPVGHAL
jgi:hypothetical protein